MYKNEEVEELKQKIILCVIVFVFVVAIGVLLIFNRFGSDVDAVTKALRNKETFVVLFTDDSKKGTLVQQELNDLGVTYYNFNVKSSSYQSVLNKMKVDYEVKLPAIYVLTNGEVSFNITDIKDEKTVSDFIQNNNILSLINEEG
ncbi:MAG: hypothetical protein PUE33_06995 [bacterium]|nr:hypothetical protein [Mycoplasmatota bacterium]MDD6757777.1 hypothetical protein [bacterium]MDY2907695.1 hypothetical protein [Candidatus Faecimonas sp.]